MHTVPVEAYGAQVGGREGDLWGIENLDFGTRPRLNMTCIQTVRVEPNLPYVDIEVADDAVAVSLGSEGLGASLGTYNATAQCLKPPVAMGDSLGSLSRSMSSSRRSRRWGASSLFFSFSIKGPGAPDRRR